MGWVSQMDDQGHIASYRDSDTGRRISAAQYERMMSMQGVQGGGTMSAGAGSMQTAPVYGGAQPAYAPQPYGGQAGGVPMLPGAPALAPSPTAAVPSSLIQPNARLLDGSQPSQMSPQMPAQSAMPAQMQPQGQGAAPFQPSPGMMQGLQGGATPVAPGAGAPPTMGQHIQGKNLRLEGMPHPTQRMPAAKHAKGFLDATSIAILLPTLVLLALIIAAAHKKRLFPWQTIRTFNPPSGLMTPRDYERSFVCPPNGRKHGRVGKKNPEATWTEADGVVIPFGFLARTHLPVTIPLGRLPNKNMFLVAPSGSGKTTLMRAVIKGLLAKPCVIIALEAKANDPNLDEKREGFKYSVLPEAQHAGFHTLYFNPLDADSVHWNPLDLDANTFASSIVQDVNSLDAEEQHWAERDLGYIEGLVQLLKWGAVQITGEDENGQPSDLEPLPCNPRGLMRLVNNRRNIVESMRRLKSDPNVPASELSELTQRLSSIIRTDSDWDKNIQGVRGRLRMFKNKGVLNVTERSNIDLHACMHQPTVLIFGAPASLGPDAESLASCFVYQLQQALHTRYGTVNVLPLFAFFDEYQTLNIDLAGRLSAIVRGANGGLTVILQNISQIEGAGAQGVSSELRTIFSNSAIRVCLHNADETTAKFFSDEVGKHAVIVPGIADHFQANGFGIFPTSWNRIHSQQVVARVDTDSIKRMEKHHALVYLSPAGDPEFGETKPFMCDLRGIEEIARLHLLHNVNARSQTAAASAGAHGGPGGGENTPGFAAPPRGFAPPHLSPGQIASAAAQAADYAANMPGFGTHPAAAAAAPSPMNDPGFGTGGYAAASAASAVSGAYAQQSQSAGYMPVQPQAAGAADNGMRICPNCGKGAGKGKFCIECGQFIGLSTTPQVQLSTTAEVMGASGFGTPTPAAPVPGGVIPSYAEVAATGAMPAGAVDSFGNPIVNPDALPLSATGAGQQPNGPRYGGLKPQSRDAMPSKRGMFENPSQIADAAQQALAPGGENTHQRRPVRSLNPDAKRQPGVEF
ncbi:MAG: type IV secretory system conjugative DNA transfer family protein [Cyanobacteria bacterium SZAS LIN-3]|nr:type IV secretory system conjugative DNA transfer family protein [Cyanobacteria bacterium SZAS LIN-3]